MNDLLMGLADEQNDEMKGKYLTFWCEDQLFGVPIADVVQIVGIMEIVEVPEFPYYVKGIINLRGTVIPVLDIRLRLGKEEIPYNERTCIIVTNINNKETGIIVDSVNEVRNISDEEISIPAKMSKDRVEGYLEGIGRCDQQMILLVNTAKVLGEHDLEQECEVIE